jgi:hypothetical protein
VHRRRGGVLLAVLLCLNGQAAVSLDRVVEDRGQAVYCPPDQNLLPLCSNLGTAEHIALY